MRNTLRVFAAAALVSAAFAAAAQLAGMEIEKMTATVESIDQKTREVVLRSKEGNKIAFVAGPEVQNLAQVAKGDIVTVAYGRALAVGLEKTSSKVRERTVTEGGQRTSEGGKPGVVAMREVKVVASVEAVDAAKGLVTLRGPEQTATVKVKDPAMLKGVKAGDFVKAIYTEATVINVQKGPATEAPKK